MTRHRVVAKKKSTRFLSLAITAVSALLIAPCVESQELRYLVNKPQDLDILPTPIRVLMLSKHEAGVESGFSQAESSFFKPLLSIGNASEMEHEELREYRSHLDYQIAQRTLRSLKPRDRIPLKFSPLHHQSSTFFVELGGHAVFFDFTQNYLLSLSSEALNQELKIPSVSLPQTDAEAVEYRFYRLPLQANRPLQIPALFYTATRNGYAESLDQYLDLFTRSFKNQNPHVVEPGLASIAENQNRWGFIFQTCVRFSNMGSVVKELARDRFNQQDLCWEYDNTQRDQVLALIPSSAQGGLKNKTMVVEERIAGKIIRSAFFDLKANTHLDLAKINWK